MRSLCSTCTGIYRSSVSSRRVLGATRTVYESRKIRDLLAKFQDPESPYYIAPGASGPAHENDHSTSSLGGSDPASKIQWRDPESPSPPAASSEDVVGEGLASAQFRPSARQLDIGREAAKKYFQEQGYDPNGLFEWGVAWGDCDMFQHANNVNYVRWLESARLRWCETLADDLPIETVMNFMHGKKMGFILKEISVRYRHPLTYPDTMIIAVKPHSINPSRASFGMAHALWSLKDNKLAATADSTIVMYDYDHKKKGKLSEEFMRVLEARSGQKRME